VQSAATIRRITGRPEEHPVSEIVVDLLTWQRDELDAIE
jgi:hypothetical protein